MKIPTVILVLNFLLSVAFFTEHWTIGAILTFIWLISAVGLLGFHKTGKKGFAYAAYAGFAPFFPIGLLAIMGIRKRMETEMDANAPMREPIRVFHFSRRFLKTWLILGLALIVAQIITQFWMKFPSPVGAVGLVFVIVALTLRKATLIEIYPDHFTYKPGPLSAKKRIYLSDIQDTTQTKKRLMLRLKSNDRHQKIMLDLLDPSDSERFNKFLTNGRRSHPVDAENR